MCTRPRSSYLAGVKLAARRGARTRRVLGVDPGTNLLGYAVLEEIGSARRVIEVGVHKTPVKRDHSEKLRSIFECVTGLVQTYSPDECAVEAPFFGKNVQSMLKLGRAQGVTMAAAISCGLSVTEYAPRKIKKSVTGGGNATKEQVAHMLASTLAFERESLSLDATDALACAVCHLNQGSLAGAATQSYAGWAGFLAANPGRVKA